MKIAIVGFGRIGKAIKKRLNEHYIEADAYDVVEQQYSTILSDFSQLDGYDTICCATPPKTNREIATYCAKNNKHYLDLSEDVETTEYLKTLQTSASIIPQCGLAPGAVNIIAHNLALQFDTVDTIQMRVGALPRYPNNNMKYYFSWSPEGVINEYCNWCDAVEGGEVCKIPPLAGYETLIIDGTEYEAFNTSGGLGTLHETWDGKVYDMNYRTIRYPGHRQHMKFLFEDLNMSKYREDFVKIFKQSVPTTKDDQVILYVKVIGEKKGVLEESTFQRTFISNHQMTAIEYTTASGICAWLWELKNRKVKTGFIRQEDYPFATEHNPYWIWS